MDHGDYFLKTYESRFEQSHGPLPFGAQKVIDRLVRCGDPHFGLTLLHCQECNVRLAVPFSCKTRVCPSCVNRRAECLSQSLAEKLPPGDYRHVVVTLPKKMGLRKRFQLNSRLHRQIGRVVHRVLRRWMAAQVGCHRSRRGDKERAQPGIIMAVQSFGAGLKSHVHFHILVTDGVYFPDGSYYALGYWDEASLLGQLRHSILKSLVARQCLHLKTAEIVESWPLERSGFSAFVGSALNQPTGGTRLERVLRYIFRPSLPLKYLAYKEATGQVVYSPPREMARVWPHATDFLADWAQHIPRPRQQNVTYAGWFSNALGKLNPKPESKEVASDKETELKPHKRWVRWRTLVLRTWAVDPELCPLCRKQMQRTKAVTEWQELQRLLKSLGIGGYPTRPRSPPPDSTSDAVSDSEFFDSQSQVPSNWDEWGAA